jgi:predicted permease
MLNDLRYSLRTLRQKPGFALTAIVSIGLGVGANAVIFSFADGILLRPLPVPSPSQIVELRTRTPTGAFGGISYPDYLDFRDHNRSFSGVLADGLLPAAFAMDKNAQPRLKYGSMASGNFFEVLQVQPHIGRGFRPDEDQVPGRNAVMVLSYDFWTSEFNADPSAVGRQVRVNGLDFTVIGVAPQSFTGPDLLVRPAFYVPIAMAPSLAASNATLLTDRANRVFDAKARLKPGVSPRAADADIAVLGRSLEQSYPATNRAFGGAVRTELQARNDFIPADQLIVAFLFAIVTVALLIACANVANLLLGRARARTREIAVRLAIGAGRARIVRQLLTESLLIALAGGAAGLLFAQAGVATLSNIQIPGDVPVRLTFDLDLRVLWFTLAVSAASALLFGLVPALQATKTDLTPALKTGEPDEARKRWFGRNALVAVQVAFSLLLLVIASQLARGFSSLLEHNPGFDADHRITMRFDPSLVRYTPQQIEQFYKTLLDRSTALPGVKSSALAYAIPMSVDVLNKLVIPEGYQLPPGKESLDVFSDVVDQHFFATLGVPLERGRGFLPTDTADSPRVAVVNAEFAKHYLGPDPVGKRFRMNDRNGPWVEVVQVPSDLRGAHGVHVPAPQPESGDGDDADRGNPRRPCGHGSPASGNGSEPRSQFAGLRRSNRRRPHRSAFRENHARTGRPSGGRRAGGPESRFGGPICRGGISGFAQEPRDRNPDGARRSAAGSRENDPSPSRRHGIDGRRPRPGAELCRQPGPQCRPRPAAFRSGALQPGAVGNVADNLTCRRDSSPSRRPSRSPGGTASGLTSELA